MGIKGDKRNTLILIVEDSLTQLTKLEQLLEGSGYTVGKATNGLEALAYLGKNRPDLVISDIVMPEMDGYELCRRVKAHEDTKDIPFLLLTMLSEPHDIMKGLESGADNFITKPYDDASLLSRIQYILVNKELRRGLSADMGMELFFRGHRYFINSDRIQILDLLISAYEQALEQKIKLEQTNKELQDALATIKTLSGIVPICARCKKIRDENGEWKPVEAYVGQHSDASFSHGVCPDCAKVLYPDLVKD